MRRVILPIVAALALGATAPAITPALAQDSGGQISMQVALDVATDLGVMTVSHTEFQGDQWEIEGRDGRGRWMEVYVDSRTGEVRHVDRGW
jgi:Peptidase propeptide and YPEB domain